MRVRLHGPARSVTVEAVDVKGRVVPTANLVVAFGITGPGAMIGLNDGDPNCHEPEKGDKHSIFHGLGQVMVQSALAGSGSLTLRATAEGLTPAEVTIDVKATAARPAVEPVASPGPD